MEYTDYAIQYYLCILRIELLGEKMVRAPEGGPKWIIKLIDYLLSEYANSREELYIIGKEFSQNKDFLSLRHRLITLYPYEFEEANEKCHWKDK